MQQFSVVIFKKKKRYNVMFPKRWKKGPQCIIQIKTWQITKLDVRSPSKIYKLLINYYLLGPAT